MATTERSISRGRDAFRSSGRGGAGNIHLTSQDSARPTDGPDDFSPTRGREPTVHHDKPLYSTGRGGAGNIRSPSREPRATADPREQEALKNEAEKNLVHSTGRGGLGNMSRSRSRGPSGSSAPSYVHSTGRGGVGNFFDGEAPSIETVMEEDFRLKPGVVHSTGRGGLANMSHSPSPGVEGHRATIDSHIGFESTGRGGAGNMKERSGSREPRSQSRGRVAEILHRVVHPLEKSSRERTSLGDNSSVQRGRATEPSK